MDDYERFGEALRDLRRAVVEALKRDGWILAVIWTLILAVALAGWAFGWWGIAA